MKRKLTFTIVLLLFVTTGRSQELLTSLNKLPASLRNKATIVFTGTYFVSRGAHKVLSGGKSVWSGARGFSIDIVYL